MFYTRFGNRRVIYDQKFHEGTVIEFPSDGDDLHFSLVVKKYFYTPYGETDSELIAEISLVDLCYDKGPIYFVSDIIAKAEEIYGDSVTKPVYVYFEVAKMYYQKREK